jgi:hypothetical protein
MGNRLQKRKKRQQENKLLKITECPNCHQKGPHFVPPSLGEKGFFICDYTNDKINLSSKEIPTSKE